MRNLLIDHARARTAAKRGAGSSKQDARHVASQARVVREEGPDPLRQGEHPLVDRQPRQHVIGEVGGHLHHAPGVAGGAEPRPLQENATRRSAAHAPHPTRLRRAGTPIAAAAGDAVGEDAAAEVGAEVVLDPLRDAVAVGVGRCGVGEEGLEVVLDEGVERRGGGLAAAVDSGGRRGTDVPARGGRGRGERPSRCGSVLAWACPRGCGGRRGNGMAGSVTTSRPPKAQRYLGGVAPRRPPVTDK
jgi:hypothetical protein